VTQPADDQILGSCLLSAPAGVAFSPASPYAGPADTRIRKGHPDRSLDPATGCAVSLFDYTNHE